MQQHLLQGNVNGEWRRESPFHAFQGARNNFPTRARSFHERFFPNFFSQKFACHAEAGSRFWWLFLRRLQLLFDEQTFHSEFIAIQINCQKNCVLCFSVCAPVLTKNRSRFDSSFEEKKSEKKKKCKWRQKQKKNYNYWTLKPCKRDFYTS